MHEKIKPHHLERKAILYVRQSSAHQVLHNRESGTLQYAMRDRLTALGWSRIDGGTNIVIFPANLVDGDQVAVHDPDHRLPQDQSSWP